MSDERHADERAAMKMDPLDGRAFREVLAHLPTGVAVITAHAGGLAVGMAANSVTSVSLEPPLILFCPAKSSTTWPGIRSTGAFCVNVMAHNHDQLVRRFSQSGIDRFHGVSYERRPTGPGLRDAVAWIECHVEAEHDAGDHTIVVARVAAIEAAGDVEPLVFFRGGYGSFRAATPS